MRSKVFKTIRKSARYLAPPYLTESAPTAPSALNESSSSEEQDKFWSTSENKLLQNEDKLLQDSELNIKGFKEIIQTTSSTVSGTTGTTSVPDNADSVPKEKLNRYTSNSLGTLRK